MLDTANENIPITTIETLARSFFRQASIYGFRQEDYIRFVNVLLDYAMNNNARRQNGPQNGRVEDTMSEKPTTPLQFPLLGKQVKIRPLDPESDRALFERWLADELGRYFVLSRTTAKELTVAQLIENDDNIIGVITLPDGFPIGVVAFLSHDPMQHKAELRKLIGEPNMRRKGYAKEATKLWIQYGTTTLNLCKIYVNTLDTNIGNIKLNEELGFRVEGILRNETCIDGEYRDVLRMGLWNGS